MGPTAPKPQVAAFLFNSGIGTGLFRVACPGLFLIHDRQAGGVPSSPKTPVGDICVHLGCHSIPAMAALFFVPVSAARAAAERLVTGCQASMRPPRYRRERHPDGICTQLNETSTPP
jgi:hypothetical protein